MARTDAESVLKILPPGTAMVEATINPFIEVANGMVTANVTCGLSVAILTEIERWLTAHLISVVYERMASKEKVGDAEVEYLGKASAVGLKATPYGETALLLDTCGGLANLGKKAMYIKAITSFS